MYKQKIILQLASVIKWNTQGMIQNYCNTNLQRVCKHTTSYIVQWISYALSATVICIVIHQDLGIYCIYKHLRHPKPSEGTSYYIGARGFINIIPVDPIVWYVYLIRL